MAWYLHPSNQLRDDELPPELVVTDRDGSIEQAYVPYNDIERLQAENANLKKLVRDVYALNWNGFDCTECPWFDECRTEGGCPWLEILHDHMRELGVKAR